MTVTTAGGCNAMMPQLALSNIRGAVRGGEQSTWCWTQSSSRNLVNAANNSWFRHTHHMTDLKVVNN